MKNEIIIYKYDNVYECILNNDNDNKFIIKRFKHQKINNVKKEAVYHFGLTFKNCDVLVHDPKFKIYQNTNERYYNLYHETAYTYIEHERIDKNTGLSHHSIGKYKNFGEPTMRKIDSELLELKKSGVNIKTYKYLRLCHDYIRQHEDYNCLKHTDLMINYATDQARNLYSILS